MNVAPGVIEISDSERICPDPVVSIIILVYKHERYLAQAIEGVIAQKVDFPIELIIGEDCSPDQSLELAKNYQLRFPELIRIATGETNVGGHENVARCVQMARGKYLALCDGDDFWHDANKLSMQIDLMRSEPETTLVHTDFDRMIGRRIKRSVHRRSGQSVAQGNAYHNLLRMWTVMTITSIYRTDIVRDFLASIFNRSDWPFGDYNLALFASTQGVVKYIATSTATWRKVYGSATNTGFSKNLRMDLAGIECRDLFMSHFPVDDLVRRKTALYSNQLVMKDAFYAGNIVEYEAARIRFLSAGGKLNLWLHVSQQIAFYTVLPLALIKLAKRILAFEIR